MANQKDASARPKNLKQDALVDRLMPDPENPQPTTQLTGWLGKGAAEGSWRLYLTPQLDEYVQFQEADVVHSEPVAQDQSSLGGTMVWLKAGATLEHMQVLRRQVQADFLSGGITSSYMPGTESMYLTAKTKKPPVPTTTRGYQCSVNPHIPACQVRSDNCGINSGEVTCGSGAFCGTGAFVCGYSVGCTVGRECSVGC